MSQESTVHEDAVSDLFETAPIGYLEIDKKGIVRRVNRRECELRGLAPREILSKRCWDLTPPADRVRQREQTERRLTAQVALVPYQREYLRPDGSLVTVEVHVFTSLFQFGVLEQTGKRHQPLARSFFFHRFNPET